MLVDTNILVYAINKDSPKHKQAQKFLKDNQGDLILTHQNILETLKVLTHPRFSQPMKPTPAIKTVLAIAKSCQIIIPRVGTEFITLELIKKLDLVGIKIFDAYLVATALSNSIYTIATDNIRDFKKFAEIKVVNPFSTDVTL